MDKERNKTGGRQKGVTNKASSQLRGMITQFLHENWQQLQRDFKSKRMHPRDRLAFIEKLLKFVVPTMASTNATIDLKNQLEALSDQDLQKVINTIIGQTSDELPDEQDFTNQNGFQTHN